MSNPSGHDATTLFLYPPQTTVNRPIPKNKLYEHGAANTRLQARFVQQVEQIIWAHKLAPDTLNLPATADVPEIEVLRLHLRTAELDHDILRSIDRAMPRPILFELHRPDQIQVVATCKRPNQADPASPHWVSFPSYASSPWLAAQTTRHPLPLALNLGSLYEQLLHRLLPLAPRSQESLPELFGRVDQLKARERELKQLENRLAKEKQFNRKVDINRQIHTLKTVLTELQR